MFSVYEATAGGGGGGGEAEKIKVVEAIIQLDHEHQNTSDILSLVEHIRRFSS